MHRVRLERPDDVEGWRNAARACLAAGVPPDAIVWESGAGTGDLFGGVAGGDAGAESASSEVEGLEGAGSGIGIGTGTGTGVGVGVGVGVGGDGDLGVDAGAGVGVGPAGAEAKDFAGAGIGAGTAAPAGVASVAVPAGRTPTVPRAFVELAERVVCHRAPERFALLYRVLWRRAHGEAGLLDCASDPDVHRLRTLGQRVARERHKMHAFVRFRRTPGVEPEHFGAWFEPEHHTLRLASGFFVRRFANMRWSIVTPEESAHWDGRTLSFGPGGRRDGRPDAEAMELLWQTYFANIFNPARLRLDAMRAEMPVKYWKNLPEAPLIAGLVRHAGLRSDAMVDAAPSEPPRFAARATAAPATVTSSSAEAVGTPGAAAGGTGVPGEHALERFADLPALHARTRDCTLCEHACRATRAVDGEGRVGAPLMLVGEQPGDREDLRGRPFVGPAGTLLRRLLADEGIEPEAVYLTNAVRHFRFEARGKRRLHRRPDVEHVNRCRRWLFEEIRLVRPRVVVTLGATAGRALLGRAVAVERERGRRFALGDGTEVRIAAHPAAILRAPDEATRAALETALRRDLAAAAQNFTRAPISDASMSSASAAPPSSV